MSSSYRDISRDEMRQALGVPESEVDETIASLVDKQILEEHHDGGFTFNQVYVDFLLDSFCHPEDADVWLG